ncbi:MAG: ATP-grasp domain-containing protein [Chitinophagaceae bacterium]
MVLFIGIPSESPLQMAISSAERAGIPHLVADQRALHYGNMAIGFNKNKFIAKLQLQDNDYNLEKLSGVYFRMMDYQATPQIDPHSLKYIGEDNAKKSGLLHQQLMFWMDITKVRVLNPPMTMASNSSKPYQAQFIKEAGFKIPPTCITTELAAMQAFQQKHQPLIYKSVSAVRSIVKELKEGDEPMLKKIAYLPTQFQQKLVGTNIRVHVVGDVLFATKIDAEATDYRYARYENKTAELSAHKLPAKIEAACFRVSKQLGLTLCGIDLFLTVNNEYYCFEVNPSPGYSYFQNNTGQDISGAIARWLYYGTAKK